MRESLLKDLLHALSVEACSSVADAENGDLMGLMQNLTHAVQTRRTTEVLQFEDEWQVDEPHSEAFSFHFRFKLAPLLLEFAYSQGIEDLNKLAWAFVLPQVDYASNSPSGPGDWLRMAELSLPEDLDHAALVDKVFPLLEKREVLRGSPDCT